jgi:hypothetical protein
LNRVNASGSDSLPKRQRSKRTISKIGEKLMAKLDEPCTWLGEELVYYWMDRSRALGETSSLISGGRNYGMYGTLPTQSQDNWVSQKELAKLYAVTAMSMLLLWIAQWLFWGGFIGLSSEECVFMHILSPRS